MHKCDCGLVRKVITTMDKALDLLPELNEYEGFCCFLLLRRKWIIKHNPDKEEEIRNLFKGDQILISKDVLHGTKRHMRNRFKKILSSILSPWFSKEIYVKGNVFDAHALYKDHPYAFSLMVTYEPRNVLKGTYNFVANMTKSLLYQNYSPSVVYNFDREWQSYVHKSNRKGTERFLMLDCENEETFEIVKEKLTDTRLIENVRYAVTTPSGGAHVILKITDEVTDVVFRKKEFLFLERNGDLEIKTGNFLTHLDVGINPYVSTVFLD